MPAIWSASCKVLIPQLGARRTKSADTKVNRYVVRPFRVLAKADDEDKNNKPVRPASRGPGMAPMSMETIEQRKAAKAFRKGGADRGGGGGGDGGGDGGDDGSWWGGDDGGEANPIGIAICGVAAVGAYFYYKGEKERQEAKKEAFREARRARMEEERQKRLTLHAKRRPITPAA